MRNWKRWCGVAAAVLVPVMTGLGIAASPASAAPWNAPTALAGTFDCGGGVTGTFVVNSGNAAAPTTWNAAHLTFDSGGTGVFSPTTFDLTFTSPSGSFTEQATKGSAPGPDTCSISASQPGFSLTGTVVGKIVASG
jgi:hypothetical protein